MRQPCPRLPHILAPGGLGASFLKQNVAGCLGFENQACGKGSIAKMNFRRSWISLDFKIHFVRFWMALEPIFMNLVALGNGLKSYAFQSDPGVTPDPESRLGWW